MMVLLFASKEDQGYSFCLVICRNDTVYGSGYGFCFLFHAFGGVDVLLYTWQAVFFDCMYHFQYLAVGHHRCNVDFCFVDKVLVISGQINHLYCTDERSWDLSSFSFSFIGFFASCNFPSLQFSLFMQADFISVQLILEVLILIYMAVNLILFLKIQNYLFSNSTLSWLPVIPQVRFLVIHYF